MAVLVLIFACIFAIRTHKFSILTSLVKKGTLSRLGWGGRRILSDSGYVPWPIFNEADGAVSRKFNTMQKSNIVSEVSTSRMPFWPVVLIVVSLMTLHCQTAMAQNDFRPNAGSAYSDGQLRNSTQGASKFEPPAINSQTPTFGRGGSSGQPASGLLSPQSSRQTNSDFGTTSGSDEGQVKFCTVEYEDEIDLPALETGQLIQMNVKEGDSVAVGTPIAIIDDKLLKLQLMQALVRKTNADKMANDDTSIVAADKQIQLTGQRYETTRKLERKGARSFDELKTAQYEYEVAQLQRRAAVVRQLEAKGEYELEKARVIEVEERINRHAVAPKFDGIVIERYKQAGEWVTAGEPVARVARMEKLYVSGLISNLTYNPSEVDGKDVVVTVELARNETMDFPGKIVFIGSKDIVGTGNEFKVKAEITNRMKQGQWVLRKETRVTMRIKLK